MSYIEDVSALAWNSSKEDSDPLFADCILSHKEKLVTHAQSVERVGVPAENPSAFEKEVARLLKDPEGTAAAISKANVESVQAAADAMAEKAKAMAASAAANVSAQKAEAAEQKKADVAEAKADAKADAKK